MQNPTPTIAELLAESDVVLRDAGVDSPRLSAQILAGHALGCDRVKLVVDAGRILPSVDAAAVRALVARRAGGEPVAYILGFKEFYGLDFAVSPAVLVPRPETEHIIEQAERLFDRASEIRFADLGTGSGCIAVTLAHRLAGAHGVALDRSEAALEVAHGNAVRHGVAGRLQFVRGDMGGVWARPASLDLVVSNPPYVSDADYRTVGFEVADFEPRSALVPDMEDMAGQEGESDGLECYRALVPRAAEALRRGGMLLLEIGWDQGVSVPEVLAADGRFVSISVLSDLAGWDRIVSAKRC